MLTSVLDKLVQTSICEDMEAGTAKRAAPRSTYPVVRYRGRTPRKDPLQSWAHTPAKLQRYDATAYHTNCGEGVVRWGHGTTLAFGDFLAHHRAHPRRRRLGDDDPERHTEAMGHHVGVRSVPLDSCWRHSLSCILPLSVRQATCMSWSRVSNRRLAATRSSLIGNSAAWQARCTLNWFQENASLKMP
jgi:hypothetical protein